MLPLIETVLLSQADSGIAMVKVQTGNLHSAVSAGMSNLYEKRMRPSVRTSSVWVRPWNSFTSGLLYQSSQMYFRPLR